MTWGKPLAIATLTSMLVSVGMAGMCRVAFGSVRHVDGPGRPAETGHDWSAVLIGPAVWLVLVVGFIGLSIALQRPSRASHSPAVRGSDLHE